LNSEQLIFKPYPKQEEFIEAVFSSKYSFLTYGGAMGGGKSYVCLAIVILLCRVYPESKWCVIRESIPTLKRTTLQTFLKIVPKGFVQSYNQQDQIVKFTNGSQIMFMAEDWINDKDFDRFKGLEVNGFLLEQIEELNEGLLDVCFIRAGRHKITGKDKQGKPFKQPKPIILANVNPTMTWPKTKIYDAYNLGTLPADWYYLPAKITDNPALFDDKEYMSRLDRLDEMTRRRLIEGDWTAFSIDKPFLYAFSFSKHVIKSYTPNPHLPLLVSFDFNVDPMTCTISQQLSVKQLIIFDEIVIPNSSTPELCDKIISKYPGWVGKFEVTGDATGSNRSSFERGGVSHYIKIKDALNVKDYQLKLRKHNPSHLNSRILCNSVLQNADFTITENCKGCIEDASQSGVDSFGQIIKTKDKGRHLLDNIRYSIDAAFPDFIKDYHLYS
jgi:hypothetical protein